MSFRNSLAALEGASALQVSGKTTAADASTSEVHTPKAFAADVVIVKTGTGVYTVTINPFKGPLGFVSTVVTLLNNPGIIHVDSETYTGDSLVITIKSFAVDGVTATDKKFSFRTLAL